jgi:hypothetical protein
MISNQCCNVWLRKTSCTKTWMYNSKPSQRISKCLRSFCCKKRSKTVYFRPKLSTRKKPWISFSWSCQGWKSFINKRSILCKRNYLSLCLSHLWMSWSSFNRGLIMKPIINKLRRTLKISKGCTDLLLKIQIINPTQRQLSTFSEWSKNFFTKILNLTKKINFNSFKKTWSKKLIS